MSLITSFTVEIHDDGRVVAIPTNMDESSITRSASELDVRQACHELLESIHLKNISRVLSAVMTESQLDEGQKVRQAVRQSLVEKGLI
jgi:hypothetical protein